MDSSELSSETWDMDVWGGSGVSLAGGGGAWSLTGSGSEIREVDSWGLESGAADEGDVKAGWIAVRGCWLEG